MENPIDTVTSSSSPCGLHSNLRASADICANSYDPCHVIVKIYNRNDATHCDIICCDLVILREPTTKILRMGCHFYRLYLFVHVLVFSLCSCLLLVLRFKLIQRLYHYEKEIVSQRKGSQKVS